MFNKEIRCCKCRCGKLFCQCEKCQTWFDWITKYEHYKYLERQSYFIKQNSINEENKKKNLFSKLINFIL